MNIAAVTSASNSAASILAAAMPQPPAPVTPGGASQVTAAQRHKAAAQFEAILVRQMLSSSVGSMMGGSGHTAGLMYGDLMTDVMAQKLTSGKGLGLGAVIEQQLTPKNARTTKVAPPIQRP
jgi:Rod binding domain-containing protein